MSFVINTESLLYATFYYKNKKEISLEDVLCYAETLEKKLNSLQNKNFYYVDTNRDNIIMHTFYNNDFEYSSGLIKSSSTRLRTNAKNYLESVFPSNVRKLINQEL